MYRRITMLFLILISYLLQSTMIRILPLGGVSPNFLIILTSSIGFMKGKKEGMFAGFVSGLVLDTLSGGLIGFYALVYMIIGYLNGFFASIFYPEDVKLPMVLISSSELVYCFIIYVFRFLIQGKLRFGYYFMHIILPEIVYTIFVTIIIYKVILNINEWLEDLERRRA
ncbi:MAG: rod shape-determining protein MreD [Lachnospiraceae bacterium]|nr:rod shape-determining protein MreD [Lachnospiraceae bacterium]